MRKTRFMSMLFLVWSIAFFFVPDFRQGLQGPFFTLSPGGDASWLDFAGTIPPKKLAEAARVAEQQHDARTLAFVALHAPTAQEGLRWADQAVAIDPNLTWVYLSLILPALDIKQNPPDVHALAVRLEKWDPDNAVPYFFEGTEISRRKNIELSPVLPAGLEAATKETEWCQAMQKGYAAPRYDDYFGRRFGVERAWLEQNHLDKPAIVLLSTATYPIPNLFQIRHYANLLVEKYGKEAEEAGHLPQALAYYWTAEHMAERMRLSSGSLIEKLIAVAVQKIANKRLVPALRKAGQTDAAAALEMGEQQLDQQVATLRGKDPLAQSFNYNWTALIVEIFAGLVAVFGALTVVCLVYVNAKRWVRPEVKGRLFQLLTVAENYMPVLLFLACAGLYLSYYPYARNFHHYMTATGEIHDFEPLFFNVFPNYGGMPGQSALPIGNPFRPYAWYALVGLILAVFAAMPYHRRAS